MQRLILGPGKHTKKQPGDFFVDLRDFAGIDRVWDLNVVPWPFNDGEFGHVSAIHLVEHLQSLIAFMDEAWRVLEVGGSLYLETPLAGADPDLEYCDPTHVRCYRPHTFINYFTKEGIERFGYTDKPWAIFAVGPMKEQPAVLRFHGTPIKSPIEA